MPLPLCAAAARRPCRPSCCCCATAAAGLTRLELSYCGEEGLHNVPANVGRCSQLRSLCLNCAMFDSDATLARLAFCTALEVRLPHQSTVV